VDGWGLGMEVDEWPQCFDYFLNLFLAGAESLILRNNAKKFLAGFIECESVSFLSHSQPLERFCNTQVLLNKS
jgi:hypothetical protein